MSSNLRAWNRRTQRAVLKDLDQELSGHADAIVGVGNRAERRQWHSYKGRSFGGPQRRFRHGQWEFRRPNTWRKRK